jgi:uncharacterized protein YcsI (UPF0317 family)
MQRGSRYGAERGAAPGFVQGNLAILLARPASKFLRFCQLNPKPCSLIGTSAPGYPSVPEVGEDLDIRIDLPPSRCDGLDRSSFEARFARTSG